VGRGGVKIGAVVPALASVVGIFGCGRWRSSSPYSECNISNHDLSTCLHPHYTVVFSHMDLIVRVELCDFTRVWSYIAAEASSASLTSFSHSICFPLSMCSMRLFNPSDCASASRTRDSAASVLAFAAPTLVWRRKLNSNSKCLRRFVLSQFQEHSCSHPGAFNTGVSDSTCTAPP